ncbi:L1 protein [human papillomavirus 114]|uniref:Major capsid protein L1 n=2 Tax=Papillomaviridae TaxID=151340 RepID=D3VWC2_9PAPI|nr:L1 protein [human papillomavirus 114]
MALWRPGDGKVYLPPTPVSKVISTDRYVSRTNLFYYGGSSRLLTVGHPYYSVTVPPPNQNKKATIPKVSGYQYRVFRVHLPDPNKFGLPDAQLYNPDTERLVWACRGIEVGRGQPLGVGTSGHPLYNRLDDTENTSFLTAGDTDSRDNVSVDYKQTQLLIVGCKPSIGEHWGKGTVCSNVQQRPGDCPPLQFTNSTIQDGDMVEAGYGAIDFLALQESKSEVPLDLCTTTCKYPDYLQMAAEPYGDCMFFCLRREQMFARHYFNRQGTMGEDVPETFYFKGAGTRATLSSSVYSPTPSGSMVSSDSQLFNKPYWLQRAQGHNNGICWFNQLFVTVVDTTRSTNFTISAATQASATQASTEYKSTNFKEYLRHVEEYDLQFIFQLCKIRLTPEIMSYLHTMNESLLDEWNFGVVPPPSTSLDDTYRYLQSRAISCQKGAAPAKPTEDPYAGMVFWDVDLKDKFSTDLDQFPLGRKFLLQSGPRSSVVSRKRTTSASAAPSSKRRKTKK